MKIKGNTDEFIELTELDSGQCTIFNKPEPSSLTILWFQTNDYNFIIDGKNYSFTKNQIVFFTEFHKIEVTRKGTYKFLRFNRRFYCFIDHDVEVSCKGILFFGASQLQIITIGAAPLLRKKYFQMPPGGLERRATSAVAPHSVSWVV